MPEDLQIGRSVELTYELLRGAIDLHVHPGPHLKSSPRRVDPIDCACIFAVVPTMQNKKCNVISPCKGAREDAMTQNNEVIFSAPITILEDLIKASHYLDKHGEGMPLSFKLQYERKLKDGYADIGRTMGIKYNGVNN